MRGLLARYHAKRRGRRPRRAHPGAHGEAVRRDEPACLVYRAARSVDDPDVFVLYEEYEDEAALLAHRETPHFRELIEGVIVPVLVSRERELLVPLLGPPRGGAAMKLSTIVREGPDGPRPRPVAVLPDDEVVIDLCTAERRRLESEGATAEAALRLATATFPGSLSRRSVAGRGFLERARRRDRRRSTSTRRSRSPR